SPPRPTSVPYTTLFRSTHQVHEGRRDGVVAAPAQVAAVQGVGGVGIADGGGAEVQLALLDHRLDAGGLLVGGVHLLGRGAVGQRSEEHTSELQSRENLV